MTKREAYHQKLDKVLNVFLGEQESGEVTLGEAVMEDGTKISWDVLEVDAPVMVMVEGEDPAPAPDGEYKISETQMIKVAGGVIAEIMEIESEEVAEDDVVMEENNVEADAETEVAETEVIKSAADIFNLEKLKELVDLSKEGFHTLTFSVANGAIEWGNIYSESFQELKKELETAKAEIQEKDLKFEKDLELLGKAVKLDKIIQAPVEGGTKSNKPFEVKDYLAKELDRKRKERDTYLG